MTATATAPAPTGVAPPRTSAARRAGSGRPWIVLLALLGVLTLAYPSAARWFSDRKHAVEVSGYTEQVDRLPDAEGRAILDRAAAYNAALPTGPLRGVSLAGGAATSDGATGPEYLDQLAVPGTDVMATLGIPSIGLDLPVRHGTDEATLGRGLGHLANSSLPVGGPGTHTVLTGHSGLVGSSMFDGLHDLEAGDAIVLTTLGATTRYEVHAIDVVSPGATDSLRIEQGEDLLTLVTCTPIGVNSHRLLVRAHRVADQLAVGDGTVAGPGVGAGFPGWMVVVGAAVVGAGVVVRAPEGARRRGAATGGRHRAGRKQPPVRPRARPAGTLRG
jgi:sortase A